jgi:hypothetical protein
MCFRDELRVLLMWAVQIVKMHLKYSKGHPKCSKEHPKCLTGTQKASVTHKRLQWHPSNKDTD